MSEEIIRKFHEIIIPSKIFKCSNEQCKKDLKKSEDGNLHKCSCGVLTCYLCKCGLSKENVTSHYGVCKLFTNDVEDIRHFSFENLKRLRDHYCKFSGEHNILYMSNKDNNGVQEFRIDGVDILQQFNNIKCYVKTQIMKVNYLPYFHELNSSNSNDNIYMRIRSGDSHFYGKLINDGNNQGRPTFIDSSTNKTYVLTRFGKNVKCQGDVLNCGEVFGETFTRESIETRWGFSYILFKTNISVLKVLSITSDTIASQKNLHVNDKIFKINNRYIRDFKNSDEIREYITSLTEMRLFYERTLSPSLLDVRDYKNVDNWKNHMNTSTIIMKGRINKHGSYMCEENSHEYSVKQKINRTIPGVTSAFIMEGTFQHNNIEHQDEFIISYIDKSNVEYLQRLGFTVFDNLHVDFHYVMANGSNEFGDYTSVGYVLNDEYTLFRNYIPKINDAKRLNESVVTSVAQKKSRCT
jgi:hypothetical protein